MCANVQMQTLSLLTALCYPTKLKGFRAQTDTVGNRNALQDMFGWPNFPMLRCSQKYVNIESLLPRSHRRVLHVLRHVPPCSARCPRRRCSSPAAPCRVAAAPRGGRPLPHDPNASSPALRSRDADCVLLLPLPLRAHTPSIWSCRSATTPQSGLINIPNAKCGACGSTGWRMAGRKPASAIQAAAGSAPWRRCLHC